MPPTLSVAIIARNEAGNIRNCLESVRFADEIVVVDGGSTDRTVEIAREFTDRVFVREMKQGFGEFKNWAMDQTTGDWILVLDADEQVSAAGQREILETIADPGDAVAFSFPRLTRFLGRDIRHCGWYDSAIIRMVRRDSGRHDLAWVHEVIVPRGPLRPLTEPLIHHTYRDMAHHGEKLQVYTTLNAKDWHAAGIRIRPRNMLWYFLLKPLAIFFRKLILMQGWRDGIHGFVISVLSAVQYFASYVKLWDMDRRNLLTRNVLFLHESAGIGGAEQSLHLLARGLPEPYQARFVLGAEGPFADRLRNDGLNVRIQPLPSIRSPLPFFRNLLTLVMDLRRNPVEIIHSNSPRSYLYGGLAARLTGARSLFHVRVMLGRERRDPVIMMRWLADWVVCNSDAIRQRFPRMRNTGTVLNGVDIQQFTRDPRRRNTLRDQFSIPETAVVIGMLNRFDPDKGWDEFFHLADDLLADERDIRLLVVGDAVFSADQPYGEKIRGRLQTLAGTGRLIHTGFRSDVPELYEAMDIVVQPSHFEGCSRILLEAQAMERAVVASRTGGNPELVEDGVTGLLFPTGNGTELIRQVRRLLDDESLRRELALAGRERIRERFNVHRNRLGIVRIYDRLIRS